MATIEITDAPIHRRSRRPGRVAHRRSRAFDDPVTRWLLPHVEQRRRRDRAVVPLYVAPYLRHGDTYMTGDGNGAAVAAARRRAAERGGGRGVRRCAGGARRERRPLRAARGDVRAPPPRRAAVLLPIPGHGPGVPGARHRSAFLRAMLTRADQEGFPAYHEATTPRNRALYERHGYLTQVSSSSPTAGRRCGAWRSPR